MTDATNETPWTMSEEMRQAIEAMTGAVLDDDAIRLYKSVMNMPSGGVGYRLEIRQIVYKAQRLLSAYHLVPRGSGLPCEVEKQPHYIWILGSDGERADVVWPEIWLDTWQAEALGNPVPGMGRLVLLKDA